MKKIISFSVLLVFSILLLASCEREDEFPPEFKELINHACNRPGVWGQYTEEMQTNKPNAGDLFAKAKELTVVSSQWEEETEDMYYGYILNSHKKIFRFRYVEENSEITNLDAGIIGIKGEYAVREGEENDWTGYMDFVATLDFLKGDKGNINNWRLDKFNKHPF